MSELRAAEIEVGACLFIDVIGGADVFDPPTQICMQIVTDEKEASIFLTPEDARLYAQVLLMNANRIDGDNQA